MWELLLISASFIFLLWHLLTSTREPDQEHEYLLEIILNPQVAHLASAWVRENPDLKDDLELKNLYLKDQVQLTETDFYRTVLVAEISRRDYASALSVSSLLEAMLVMDLSSKSRYPVIDSSRLLEEIDHQAPYHQVRGREYYEFRTLVRDLEEEDQMTRLEEFMQEIPILIDQTPLTEEEHLFLMFTFREATWPQAWARYQKKFQTITEDFSAQTSALYYCRYDRSSHEISSSP